ncbi:glycosyltransferase family 39 protein [[Pseudomonas] carboxydohydrogena]|uniref:Glycosyltransferase family 39 protein n=1 Tax=Afipia carboxydohydrogena TaxID=290 RepID=A0ABY8BS06_AFICR|nr:glycosyltransferase family 39 protein [[Pseudomonas] carboxydohydrogena]WEF52753.1 glycosyltransferase family 39 protein [[Pseudomonas] carboxydohydrogena]
MNDFYFIIVALYSASLLALTCFHGASGHEKKIGICFLASTSIAILAARFPIVVSPNLLNPDEALFAAGAMRTTYGWTTWGIVDPTTSGPLNSMVLTWPYIFGGDATLFSGRVTAIMLSVGTIYFLYRLARLLLPPAPSIAAVAPAALFYIIVQHPDFTQFSSEHLPVFLICGTLYFVPQFMQDRRLTSLWFAAIMTGAIPFAKLQGAVWTGLLCLAIAAACLLERSDTRTNCKRLAIVIAGGVSTAAILLVPVCLAGNFDDFIKSALIEQYHRSLIVDANFSAIKLLRIIGPLHRAYLIVGITLAACAIFVIARYKDARTPLRLTLFLVVLAGLSVPVAIITVVTPARTFPHYLQFMIPSIVVLMIVAVAILLPLARRPRPLWSLSPLLVLVSIISMSTTIRNQYFYQRQAIIHGSQNVSPDLLHSPEILSWLSATPDDSIVCWGWNPKCYLDTNIRPATRDMTNEVQIYDLPLRPYFRQRFIQDFDKSPATFLIDFVGPRYFGFNDPSSEGVQSFPELAAKLQSEFQNISTAPDKTCPAFFVRKSRLKEFDKSRVIFDRMDGPSRPGFPPAAVDDNAVFEGCRNSWLLPKNQGGELDVAFAKPSPLRRVGILNTKNSPPHNAAADRVLVSIRNGSDILATRTLTVNQYPKWTYVTFPDLHKEADGMTIRIISWHDEGGGLNEVKAFTD